MTEKEHILFYNMEQCIHRYPDGCTPESTKLSFEVTHQFCLRYPELLSLYSVSNFDDDEGYNYRIYQSIDVSSEKIVDSIAEFIANFYKEHSTNATLVVVGHCQNFDQKNIMGENYYRIDIHISLRN